MRHKNYGILGMLVLLEVGMEMALQNHEDTPERYKCPGEITNAQDKGNYYISGSVVVNDNYDVFLEMASVRKRVFWY
jgi:hypothetical protein